MSVRNHVTRRSRGRRNGGRLLVKALSLIVAGMAGYFLGVRWIGPSFIGHANAVVSSTGSAPASTAVTPAANSSDTASPAANVSSEGSAPVAIITDRRHHRADDGSGADATDATIPPRDHPIIHHRRRRPAHPHVDTNPDQAAGDQTVLPEDAAKVGGSDNQPAGQDSTGPDTSSLGDSTAPAPADGASNPPAASNDSGSPGVGDNTAPAPSHRRRRRQPRPEEPTPAPPAAPSTGDTTPAPGDNSSAPAAGDHGAGDHSVIGRWASV